MATHGKRFAFAIRKKSGSMRHLSLEELHGLAWDAFLPAVQKFNPEGGKSFPSWWYQAIVYHMGHTVAPHNKFYTRNVQSGKIPMDLYAHGSSFTQLRNTPAPPKTRDVEFLLRLTTPKRARSLRLRYLRGLSLGGVGAEMGISKNSASQNVSRGLQDLRRKLTKDQADALTQL